MLNRVRKISGRQGTVESAIQFLRDFARTIEDRTRAPYESPVPERRTVVTTAPKAEAPKARGTPRLILKADGSLVPSSNWPKPEQPHVPKPWEVNRQWM